MAASAAALALDGPAPLAAAPLGRARDEQGDHVGQPRAGVVHRGDRGCNDWRAARNDERRQETRSHVTVAGPCVPAAPRRAVDGEVGGRRTVAALPFAATAVRVACHERGPASVLDVHLSDVAVALGAVGLDANGAAWNRLPAIGPPRQLVPVRPVVDVQGSPYAVVAPSGDRIKPWTRIPVKLMQVR